MRRKMDIDNSKHDFKFTRNDFRDDALPAFRQFVHPHWAGKPITYLEIGVFEGQSLVWMFQHILTHPDSRAVGIDPWKSYLGLSDDEMEKVGDRAHHNLKPWFGRFKLVPDRSEDALGGDFGLMQFVGAKYESVDICFLDGNKNRKEILVDAILCWPILKVGGWIIFGNKLGAYMQADNHQKGIKKFLEYHEGETERLWEVGGIHTPQGFEKTK